MDCILEIKIGLFRIFTNKRFKENKRTIVRFRKSISCGNKRKIFQDGGY